MRPEATAEQEVIFGKLTRVLLKDRRVGMAMGVQMLELLDEPMASARPATRPATRPAARTPSSTSKATSPGRKDKADPLSPSSRPAVTSRPAAVSRPSAASQPAQASRPAASGPATSQPALSLAPSPARVLLSTATITPRFARYLSPARTTPMKNLLSPLVEVTMWPESPVAVGQTWERKIPWMTTGCVQRARVEKIESVKGDTRVTLVVNSTVEAKDGEASPSRIAAQTRLVWSIQDQELVSLVGESVSREPSTDGGKLISVQISYERVSRRQMPQIRLTIERQAIIHLAQAIMAYQRGDAEAASTATKTCVSRWPTSYWRPLADDLLRRIDADQQARTPLTIEQLKAALSELLNMLNQAEAGNDEALAAWCGVSFHRYAQINGPELRKLLNDSEPRFRGLACLALAFGTVPAEVGLIEEHSDDSEVQVRRLCLRSLALRGSPVANGERLLAGVKDSDAIVRRWACEALGTCTTKVSEHWQAARTALSERLTDESALVALAAAKALVRIGTPGDVEKVKQLAEKESRDEVRSALTEILSAAESRMESEEPADQKAETKPAK